MMLIDIKFLLYWTKITLVNGSYSTALNLHPGACKANEKLMISHCLGILLVIFLSGVRGVLFLFTEPGFRLVRWTSDSSGVHAS